MHSISDIQLTKEAVSTPMLLAVFRPDDADTRLPIPSVAQAVGDELDLGRFQQDADVMLPKWPLMAAGQLLWLRLEWDEGSVVLAAAHPITTTEVGTTLDYKLLRAHLLRIADGTTIVLKAEVAFNGSSTPADRVVFPHRRLTLRVAGEAFFIDTTRMTLEVGKSNQRQARGGTPPYHYASANANIATVDASSGMVNARAVGTTSMTAGDSASHSARYAVEVIGTSPPFAIDPTTMVLNIGSTAQRQATGGLPPYSYTSANTGVATVGTSNGTVTARAIGTTTVTARDSASRSAAYGVRVEPATTPLYIDRSALLLNSPIVHHGERPVPYPPPGATATRQASGGTPPYYYSVDRPVVELNASTGRIVSHRNGSATVTVRDSAGSSASYPVTVQDAWLVYFGQAGWWATVRGTVQGMGGDFASIASWELLRQCYGGNHGITNRVWTLDADGAKHHWAIYPHTGQTVSLLTWGLSQAFEEGWGMRPFNL